jgi:SAM-dependent methyltransferase
MMTLGIGTGMRVIDLCCGDGLFTVAMVRIASDVVAIDLGHEMIERTRAKIEGAGLNSCRLIEGDAYDIAARGPTPLSWQIRSTACPTKRGCARRLRRPSSVMAFIVVNWHRQPRETTTVFGQPRGPATEMRMEAADVAAFATLAGFKLERTIEMPPYHYAAVLRASARPRASVGCA